MAVENTFEVNFDSHLILLYKQNHESQYKGIFSDILQKKRENYSYINYFLPVFFI